MLKPATRGCLATAFLVAAACASTAQGASQAAAMVTPCTATQAGVCRETLTLARDAKLAYYRTYSLSAPNTQVTKAVLVIHGTDRNALAAFTQVLNAAKATSNVANTIILAPRFPIKEDTPPPGFLYWDRKDGIDHGWKQGDDAISANPMSAFTVADRILRLLNLATRFPNLQQVTVVGHSGGGQYTQRYALGGKQPPLMRAGVTVRYVAANPGSYTYLNGFRPDLADPTYQTWQVPVTSCPYNRYKYGLEGLNDYMDDTPPATLVAQYPTRRVTYLLGELDTSRAGTFDSSCQADLQGLHRLERGSAFAAFMDRYHLQHRHQRVVVPGVAHAAGLMFNSPQGRAAIFPASGGGQLRLAG